MNYVGWEECSLEINVYFSHFEFLAVLVVLISEG